MPCRDDAVFPIDPRCDDAEEAATRKGGRRDHRKPSSFAESDIHIQDTILAPDHSKSAPRLKINYKSGTL
jgi:hypothetical protein